MLSKGSKRKRHKRHGFRHRMQSKAGQNILKKRRSKGRHAIAVVKNFYGRW